MHAIASWMAVKCVPTRKGRQMAAKVSLGIGALNYSSISSSALLALSQSSAGCLQPNRALLPSPKTKTMMAVLARALQSKLVGIKMKMLVERQIKLYIEREREGRGGVKQEVCVCISRDVRSAVSSSSLTT